MIASPNSFGVIDLKQMASDLLLPLQPPQAKVPSASAMRTLVWGVFFMFLATGMTGAATNVSDHEPVEITSTGETTYENGIATARDNVAIHVGDTDIYGDFAQYNSRTHEVSVEGHVRIYRDVSVYIAERGVYNIDTKQIRTSNVRTEFHPYFLSGRNVTETSANVYRVEDSTFTTDDSPRPDFHLRARTVRVYENDHVVFQNVTFYIGQVPVFWWPYMYQSLNDAFSFSIAPADLSSWGPSLLTQFTFPITDDIKGRLRLDYRGRRGPAIGFDSDIDYGKDKSSNLKIKTYYVDDQNPDINPTAIPRREVLPNRYRLTLQDTTDFTKDISGIVNVTKLSDAYVMQDFYQSEFRVDPNPDNVIAVAKTDPFTRSPRSLVSRQMISFKQRSACLRSCSTLNGTRSLAAQFSTREKRASRTYIEILPRGRALKIMGRRGSIRFISCSIRILILAGFPLCPERAFERPITTKLATSGTHCSLTSMTH